MAYTYAYIGIKRLGAGQFYLISISDKDGNPYDGGKTYRLTVPPNAPVEQYWSVTAYDRQTHALIRNMSRASRSSQIPEMQKNADGSIDVYFGPRGAGRQGGELGADRPEARLRADVPPLRSDEGALRQDMEIAGRCDRERPIAAIRDREKPRCS